MELEISKKYEIDFDKVQTIEDIKLILKELGIGFEPLYKGHFDNIKHLLKEFKYV